MRRWLLAVLFLTNLLVMSALDAPVLAREVVVAAPGQAALAQPMVQFEVRDPGAGNARSAGAPSTRTVAASGEDALGELLARIKPTAILDTGASSHVVSHGTATRLGIAEERGARYVESGMSGDHAMAVSRPYTLALANEGAPGAAALTFAGQRFLLNAAPDDLMTLLTAPGAATDVIGMPVIRTLIVDMQSSATPMPPAVRFLTAGAAPDADLWIDLEMQDFNRRRYPQNRGALPTLSENPLVRGMRARVGARSIDGDWLLDTGSAVTILSTAMAKALGLVDGAGRPARTPDFALPVSGVSGTQAELKGFRVDRLELDTEDGSVLVIPQAPVLVHDVKTTTDDGREIVLDGVLGMNLLLASGNDVQLGSFAEQRPAAFEHIVIDGAQGRLGLTPRH